MLKGMISSRLEGVLAPALGRRRQRHAGGDAALAPEADGSLDGDPQVEQPRGDALFRIAAEAAMRAVRECSPFALPPDKYSTWRTITWEFDPSQMM